jgi:hypothetical protein
MPLFQVPIRMPIQMPLFKCLDSNASQCLIQMPRFKCLYSNASLLNAFIQMPLFKCPWVFALPLEPLHFPPCAPEWDQVSALFFFASPKLGFEPGCLETCLVLPPPKTLCVLLLGSPPVHGHTVPPVLDQSNPSAKSISQTRQSNPSVFCRD